MALCMLSMGKIDRIPEPMSWALSGLVLLHAFICIYSAVAAHSGGEHKKSKSYPKLNRATNIQHDHRYSVAKCLKCGLCLEVCPNYRYGEDFFGAVFANDSYLAASQSADNKNDVVNEYKKHFGAGCSKALSCQTVCPANIETLTSIMRMNRK